MFSICFLRTYRGFMSVSWLQWQLVMLTDRCEDALKCEHMHRICEQAARTHSLTHTLTCMLLTSITPHLLVPAGQLDASLHLHLVNIHSHCQDDTLSKVHAEPQRMHADSKANAHNTPQTDIQEPVRLAFCCYCNSVIPRCQRPHGGQGVGFCCVCTL